MIYSNRETSICKITFQRLLLISLLSKMRNLVNKMSNSVNRMSNLVNRMISFQKVVLTNQMNRKIDKQKDFSSRFMIDNNRETSIYRTTFQKV